MKTIRILTIAGSLIVMVIAGQFYLMELGLQFYYFFFLMLLFTMAIFCIRTNKIAEYPKYFSNER